MQRVSEVITTDEIKIWDNSSIITIKAGTGVGKSYFIKNILYAFAKKNNKRILILIHRSNCVNQFNQEIIRDKKTDIIDVKTYQHLEALRKNKKGFDFSQYEYIVADEFHYFISDSAYNNTCDMSLNMILAQTDIIKIFMSATGDHMKTYINNIKKIKTIDYELPISFDFIENLSFYSKDETLEKFIEEAIEKNQKGIFFIQSAKKAYDLYKKYKKNCLFNCSKNNDEYYKYVDKNKISEMLKNERFEELILITTTCMDAGVNIIDEDVRHIVCDIKDVGSLIQCIGRKRIQHKDDKILLYIKTINNKQLGGMKTQLKRKITMADFLRKHTVKEFIEEFPRQYDCSNIVYDETVDEKNKGTKKINELMYFKCRLDICAIELMLLISKNNSKIKYGYCKYLGDIFGFDYPYRIIEENYKEDTMQEYLESIIGKKLFTDNKKELIEKIGLKDARGRLQKSISQLNAYFESNKLKFIILSKTTKDENRKTVRFWEVNSLSE